MGTLKKKDSELRKIEAQHEIMKEAEKGFNKESHYLALSDLASRPIQLQEFSGQEKESKKGIQVGQ